MIWGCLEYCVDSDDVGIAAYQAVGPGGPVPSTSLIPTYLISLCLLPSCASSFLIKDAFLFFAVNFIRRGLQRAFSSSTVFVCRFLGR